MRAALTFVKSRPRSREIQSHSERSVHQMLRAIVIDAGQPLLNVVGRDCLVRAIDSDPAYPLATGRLTEHTWNLRGQAPRIVTTQQPTLMPAGFSHLSQRVSRRRFDSRRERWVR